MILIIDNYDSFTYNLYQYMGEIYPELKVVRNDKISLSEIEKLNPSGIVLSPGPGRPENAGICVDVIKNFKGRLPILGICLGHQAIGYAFGGNIIGAGVIMHGKTSGIKHNGEGVFKGIKNPLTVMRYHSLVIDKKSFPDNELEICAETKDEVIMAVKHKKYDIYGLQFHPESIMTDEGKCILKNFINICKKEQKIKNDELRVRV